MLTSLTGDRERKRSSAWQGLCRATSLQVCWTEGTVSQEMGGGTSALAGSSDPTLLTLKVEIRTSAFLEKAHALPLSSLSPSVTRIVNSKIMWSPGSVGRAHFEASSCVD